MTSTTTHDGTRNLELAGLFSPSGEAYLDRAVPVASWLAPVAVGIEDGMLVRKGEKEVFRSTGPKMLDAFLKLKTDSQIVAFAKKWGFLGLCCGHPDKPAPHARGHGVTSREQDGRLVLSCGEPGESEALTVWRSYVRQFRAILNLAAAAHRGLAAEDQDLRDVLPPGLLDGHVRSGRLTFSNPGGRVNTIVPVLQLVPLQQLVAGKVTELMVFADLKVGLFWNGAEPPKVLTYSFPFTLLGALTLKLAYAVAGQPDAYRCAGCSVDLDISDRRRPAQGRRAYCEECREKGIPQRDATRDSRDRKRSKRL
jgi:hypothetical protein